jgi:hypothetical protein
MRRESIAGALKAASFVILPQGLAYLLSTSLLAYWQLGTPSRPALVVGLISSIALCLFLGVLLAYMQMLAKRRSQHPGHDRRAVAPVFRFVYLLPIAPVVAGLMAKFYLGSSLSQAVLYVLTTLGLGTLLSGVFLSALPALALRKVRHADDAAVMWDLRD